MLKSRLCLIIRGGDSYLRILISFFSKPLGSSMSLLSHILSLGPMGLFKPKQDSLVSTSVLPVNECGKKNVEVTVVNIRFSWDRLRACYFVCLFVFLTTCRVGMKA